jgi:hypothetical protein
VNAGCKLFLYAQPAIIALLFFLTACNREQMDDCFTRTGPMTAEERPSGYFERIELYDNINLVLIEGNQPVLKVEAGEKLLEAIKTEISDSTLHIRNTLKCNWVRSYEREITVYVSAPALREIRYEGSGDVRTEGPFITDSLQVSIWGGAGSFNLDLQAYQLNLALHYGTVDLNVKGRSVITTIFANSYGPFYCNDLISNIVYIRNSGTNNCHVHAEHILEAEITSVGNIYYTGNPYELKSSISGSGKLIKAD